MLFRSSWTLQCFPLLPGSVFKIRLPLVGLAFSKVCYTDLRPIPNAAPLMCRTKLDTVRQPITWSPHLPYILEPTFACIFLFLEQFSPQVSLNFQESILYSALYCFVLCWAVLYCIILYCIAYRKRNLKAPQFLKIERYTQRLSHRVCMGDRGSR